MKRTRSLLGTSPTSDSRALFESICRDVSEDLDADLVSVWTFNTSLTQIECRCSFDSLQESISEGTILKRDDYPTYFQYILEDTLINAPRADKQIATRELADSYFIPNGIKSLLDFILHDDFKPIGVICCENRREVRNWSKSDENYMRAIATLTSFIFSPA